MHQVNKYPIFIFDMQPLLLLHGAAGAPVQLKPLADKLKARFDVFMPGFTGHGGSQFTDAPFSMQLFASDVLRFMQERQLDKVSVFGYSMGGYVGMYLARHFPEKVTKVITLATKYRWDEAIAAKELQMLNPEKIEQKIPAFAAILKERHSPGDWKAVLNKTAEMMMALGKDNSLKAEDYAIVSTPSLLLLGDRDKMVSLDETVAVYKSLPNAQMAILPNTPHPIEQADLELLSFIAARFME
jgi:pimeloyl-ACP methyl ester carboxylesterase